MSSGALLKVFQTKSSFRDLGTKREPKRAKREPKGSKREPKGAKREPKGAKREPKGSQSEARNLLKHTLRKSLEKGGDKCNIFWSHFGPKSIKNATDNSFKNQS